MNIKEILNYEPRLFPSADDWNAFVELAKSKDAITGNWFTVAAKNLQTELRTRLPEDWTMDIGWGGPWDTEVHLTKFGRGSLALAYGFGYEFRLFLDDHAAYDSEKVDQLLKTSRYSPILHAFNRIDEQFGGGFKAMWRRNFVFGSPNDGCIPLEELAWYAGNKTEEFVDQAIAHIEKFTRDTIITGLLSELNEEVKRDR